MSDEKNEAGDEGEEPRGIQCPDCGCRHLPVLYTRPAYGGRVMRRRECRHCGRRMTTYEQPPGGGC